MDDDVVGETSDDYRPDVKGGWPLHGMILQR
jgi:hypothetical protein